MKESRLPLLLGMLALAVVGVLVGLIGLPDRERRAERPQPAAADATPPLPAEPDAAPAPRRDEPEIETAAIPETPLVVDSYPPTRYSPLDRWTVTGTLAGHFDTLSVLADVSRSELAGDGHLDGNARLLAASWAGDPELGLPLRDVLIGQCGRIIARARVTLDRPDVADAVHPNLGRSGWEAVLHVSDLAICAEPDLRAWAVLPTGEPALLPLLGSHRSGIIDQVAEPSYHVSALPPLDPRDLTRPDVSEIEVTASRVNLRRCAGTACPRVAQIEGGRHLAHIAARQNGWTLLVLKDRAGWMADCPSSG
jgi:hypothetical protein